MEKQEIVWLDWEFEVEYEYQPRYFGSYEMPPEAEFAEIKSIELMKGDLFDLLIHVNNMNTDIHEALEEEILKGH